MKKYFLGFISIFVFIGLTACSNPVEKELLNDELSEMTCVQEKATSIKCNEVIIVDNITTDESIDLEKEVSTLEILPDHKVHFTKVIYSYYEKIDENEYVTLKNPVVIKTIDDSMGTFSLWTNNRIMFNLEDKEKVDSLQNGAYWEYELTKTTFKITKVQNIKIDGQLIYSFKIVKA